MAICSEVGGTGSRSYRSALRPATNLDSAATNPYHRAANGGRRPLSPPGRHQCSTHDVADSWPVRVWCCWWACWPAAAGAPRRRPVDRAARRVDDRPHGRDDGACLERHRQLDRPGGRLRPELDAAEPDLRRAGDLEEGGRLRRQHACARPGAARSPRRPTVARPTSSTCGPASCTPTARPSRPATSCARSSGSSPFPDRSARSTRASSAATPAPRRPRPATSRRGSWPTTRPAPSPSTWPRPIPTSCRSWRCRSATRCPRTRPTRRSAPPTRCPRPGPT